MLPPVIGDIDTPRKPDVIVILCVIEKTGERGRPARPAGKSAMQPDRHHAWPARTFFIENVKRVPEVVKELFA